MDLGFHKKERLRLKRAFSYLFDRGSSFQKGLLRFYYVFDIPEEYVHAPVSVAFAAPKRNFKKAVHRNLLKRRMREAYRLHKNDLSQQIATYPSNLAFLVKYQKPFISDYRSIEKDMQKGLEKLSRLHHHYLQENSE